MQLQCHECRGDLQQKDFSVRTRDFPSRLKAYEGHCVLVEFDCPNCKRDGVAYAGLSGFVPRKHFEPAETDLEEVMP